MKKDIMTLKSCIAVRADGSVDIDQSMLNAHYKIRPIFEKMQKDNEFDLSYDEIEKLCLAVFYARPSTKRMEIKAVITLSLQHIEVPSIKYFQIYDKMDSFLRNNAVAKNGKFSLKNDYLKLRE